MKNLNILLFLLLILSTSLSAQTFVYKGYKGDQYIGDMIVKRIVEGDKVSYRSDAQLSVDFILNWKMRFYYEAEFLGGKLEKSLVRLSRDGKLKTLVEGKRVGEEFHSIVDGDPVKYDAPVFYCVLNTYFEAPKNRETIFSERWGTFIEVVNNGDGSYLLQPPNGSHNTLIYEDGICQEMQFNHSLAKVRFVLEK